MPRYRITIKGKDREAMLDLVRVHKIQVYDHGINRDPSGVYTVHASAQPADIDRLKSAGYTVEQHEDVDKHGTSRQAEVGRGDRYRKSDRD